MKKMKPLAGILLALTTAISATACSANSSNSSQSSSQSSASSSESGSASSNEPAKNLELKMWVFLNPESTEDPRNVVLKNIVEDYNANNEYGNKVVVESINYAKIESQTIQAAAAGTGPDIINIYTDMLKQHIAGDTVQPMTEMAEDFISTMPDYSYSADSLKINNEIYTLPWESRTFVYWYRDDIYSSIPKTLDELAETAGGQSTDLAQAFVIGLSDGSNAASFMESYIPYLRSAGGSLFDDSGKAVFNSEAGVKALNFIKKLVDNNAMNNSTLSLTVDDVIDGFKAGTILSCNAGTQRAAAIRKSELTANIKSAPIPGFEEDKSSPALVAGQSLGIGKYAQDAAASFDFIKTFYSEDTQKEWLKANVLPVRQNVYNDAEIKALSNYDEIKSWSEYASAGKVEFYPADYSELSVKLVQAAQNVVFNSADAQKSLDEVADWYNQKNNK